MASLVRTRSQVPWNFVQGRLVLPGSPKRTHPEPHSVPIEQFLAMLCFDQRDKLAELPIDLNRSGRDDFI